MATIDLLAALQARANKGKPAKAVGSLVAEAKPIAESCKQDKPTQPSKPKETATPPSPSPSPIKGSGVEVDTLLARIKELEDEVSTLKRDLLPQLVQLESVVSKLLAHNG